MADKMDQEKNIFKSNSLRRLSKKTSDHTIVINPATLKSVGKVKNSDLTKIPKVFAKARKAQKYWAQLSFQERASYIKKMQHYIINHAEKLAEIVSRDSGKSRIDALATEVIPCALATRWYAKNAKKSLKAKNLYPSSILFFNKRSQIVRLPLGVVGIISPWNYPLSIPFGEVVMGLMAGNAIILKVAAATARVGEAIQEILSSADLPDGLFTHLVGSGRSISRAMFENNIDKIFFTGSVNTGKHLMEQASKTLTPLSLELGGKDPMIVFEDADLERAANGAIWAGYQNAGQSCAGVERVYVQESVYEKFIALLAEKTKMIRHGFDADFEVEIGSMTVREQQRIVTSHLKDAVKKGAKVIAESKFVGKEEGYFFPATLLVDVDHSMDVMSEETFGPILPVMKFKTESEALELANDSNMALTSSVWSRNIARAKRFAIKIESGVTTINDHLYTHGLTETPWGGWKESGFGRTHAALGLEEMTQVKVINWDFINTKRNLWWFPFSKKTYKALLAGLRFSFPKNIIGFIKNFLVLGKYLLDKIFSPWEK